MKACMLRVLQLLQARLGDAQLVIQHCRALEAFARCLAAFPDLMPSIMSKARGPLFAFVQSSMR
jgi:hypothetical protein